MTREPERPERDEEIDALVEQVTRALDVPEPSPLFWERFPERVRAAVAAQPLAPAPAWWRRHAMALSLSGALCAALAVWVLVPSAPAVPARGAATDSALAADAGDAAWSIVSASAESAGIDALRDAGFSVRAGGADAVIEELTQAERLAFVALIEAEMKKGAPDGL